MFENRGVVNGEESKQNQIGQFLVHDILRLATRGQSGMSEMVG